MFRTDNWNFLAALIKDEVLKKPGDSAEEQHNKKKLQDKIAQKDINALLDYSEKYYKSKEDVLYLLREFSQSTPCFDTYVEYARIIWLCWRNNLPNLTAEQNELCCEKIIENLDAALKLKPKNSTPYLYYARFYKYNPQCSALKGKKLYEMAEKYYSLAIKYGSQKAGDELKAFLRQKSADTAFELFNTDKNLKRFIINIKENQEYGTFSILIYGPEGSGKLQFAYKLLTELKAPYNELTADKFFVKNRFKHTGSECSLRGKIDECRNNGKAVTLIHHADMAFSLGKADDDFSGYQNMVSVLEKIREADSSLILIVNDINNLPSDLVNAFTFRIKFSYMEEAQKAAAYNLFFDRDAPHELSRIGNLVIDDFARIKKRALIENFISNDEKLLQIFEEEAKFKAGGASYLKPEIEFDEMLINSDISLSELTAKLKDKKNTPFTMMLYGAPGTGKSYYLRWLAEKMGINTIETTAAELFSNYQGEPARNVIRLFRRAEDEQAIIILDEIEEIISSAGANMESSSWRRDMTNAFLTCLENSKVPFACTTNYMEKVDKAILRRFVFKLKFDYLTKIQCRYAFKHAFKMEPPADLDKIGGLTNGDFSTVKKKAIILDMLNDQNALLTLLKDEAAKKAQQRVSEQAESIKFDPNFINTDTEALDLFINNIKREDKTAFSILLYGPSGTGKSLYLRHLAAILGYEVIERRASDILSKWYGESEKNLAAAFDEAKNRRAFLIFDEIDSFLYNKENILQPGHMQLVNEFLVQLEKHPYPVGGTTNYIENIEKTSLRRFKFQAKFDYLKPDQYDYVYHKTFAVEPQEELKKMKCLTSALFSLVYEKVNLADAKGNPEKIWQIFAQEAERQSQANAPEKEDKTYKKLKIKALPLYNKPIAENYTSVLKGFVKIILADGHGSGFFITEDGFILTNKHVVTDEKFVTVELFSGRQVPGEVLRTNSLDVALIKVSKQDAAVPMPLRIAELNVGSTVYSLGNPGEHDQVLAKGTLTRYTTDTEKRKRIETDNFSYGGASGGPLMDEYGNVIGINVAHWLNPDSRDKISLGLAMQVPLTEALEVLNITVSEK